jgi:tryptophan synthase alpha chain
MGSEAERRALSYTGAMTRISEALARAKAESRLALVAYVTCGFPDAESTPSIVWALVDGGADMVELGVPFSDPVADGATIQKASFRALEAGMTVSGCLGVAAEIRRGVKDVPLVLMSYANPILAFGNEAFVEEAAAAGVDGLIVVDLPPEEGADLRASAREAGLDNILLVAPGSDDERIRRIAAEASGLVYCVSIAGVTGARAELPAGLPDFLARVRRHTSLPLAVGFGVSRPEHLRSLHGLADAAVVGSAIVDVIDSSPPGEIEARLKQYVRSLVSYRERSSERA